MTIEEMEVVIFEGLICNQCLLNLFDSFIRLWNWYLVKYDVVDKFYCCKYIIDKYVVS